MSRCVVESPVPPADLIVLSPGYEVPPDLATILVCTVYVRGARNVAWNVWSDVAHCDVKRVISCRNDVMNL